MDASTPQPVTTTPLWLSVLQWACLILGSGVLAVIFETIGMPATFLLAPMMAGIVAGAFGATIALPRLAFNAGQSILGILVASSLSPDLIGSFLSHWMLFLFVVLSTLCASSLSGYLISRWGIMPGTSGVWGSAPGASTAMVLMAEAFGADTRLVAFMQYFRVVIVTVIAALVARFFVDTSAVVAAPIPWFPQLDPQAFASTILVAAIGATVGKLLRLPSPFFLGAMVLGVTLEFSGLTTFQLPQWLLAVSYPMIGWTIGLKFTRPILRHVFRILPQIAGFILVLVLFCGGLAALLVVFTDIDPLTAYLATSPGGMDSVAIIAAASKNVNLSFVMSVQMLRFLIVLLFGPALSQLVAKLVARSAA
ncbi:AbrB family transcriptional regulator [Tianweitania sp. BSSL-BM11]|uniref:AbrB family transcriptional regulator n=1 Tax=Tianweitania aestuarii TaxID=2814886 RepID=A0ABS5RVM8_9HYPH|nr:AbrB family transcriptional regulator [Tianweitania aestuarii]MBS9721104.1 AbrB family transcriptional regulator [Tianweitania aestuarii]